eukprot:TRINITY_DN24411_c0_g2_i1.p1 TRINITY_DN24411_c0_g2~~TRINITY_DN24411_c0_g2_i1.p1  ORF type:complete len:215 (+),score=49.69 TRINITY_DN24411_c0_g2_i1:27-647(+)
MANKTAIILFSLIYVIFFPFVSFGFFVLHRKNLSEKNFSEIFGPLMTPYRPGFEFWEWIRLFYKFAIVFTRDVLFLDTNQRRILSIAVVLAMLLMDELFLPLRRREINVVCILWSELSLLIVMSQFAFDSSEISATVQTGLVSLIFLFVGFVFIRSILTWIERANSTTKQLQTRGSVDAFAAQEDGKAKQEHVTPNPLWRPSVIQT